MKSTDANRFAVATDAQARGEWPAKLHGPDPDLDLAAELRRTAGVRPDPGFAAALRAELLARIAWEHTAARKAQPGSGGGSRAATTPHTEATHFAPLDTPVGRIFVAHRDGRVVSTSAARDAAAFERGVALELGVQPVADAALPAALREAILDHLEGRRRFEEVDLSWLRPFQRRVLEKTAEIPRGEVRPYGWVAREIGSPGATRAVGTALGRNPIPFIIPCHRVVRADGSLGEYSGGGPEVKLRVLRYEGVAV